MSCKLGNYKGICEKCKSLDTTHSDGRDCWCDKHCPVCNMGSHDLDDRYKKLNERVKWLEKEVEALTNICKKLICQKIFGDF